MIVYQTEKLNYRIEPVRSENGLYLIMESWENHSGLKFEYILEVTPVGSGLQFANQRASFHRAGIIV